jgi:hypothetical protein
VQEMVTGLPSARCVESVKTRALPAGTAVSPMVTVKPSLVSVSGAAAGVTEWDGKFPAGRILPLGSFPKTETMLTPVRPEAWIRDRYDAFLDGLERSASSLRPNLIEISALRAVHRVLDHRYPTHLHSLHGM